MTTHIFMFIFFIIMGALVFLFPLLKTIPESKEMYVTIFQVSVFICSILSGLNAFDDIKVLIANGMKD
ncbi:MULTISPECIES: hypothetical protein [unclassified Pseudoalteromonas]|uniref:hypothetical protein n=1 Tax=unclassified Pseudoalteromonas TaxID=194690 RepID=UPI001601BEAD|nr:MULTISPECIES: hypothetical protein [unclassified Pseudoalteromonas]MBB1295442.1 hypothetical protein [Pseudoalteromonas sp. SR41-4]MBB1333947.1 hypothetical protein [Pseudoalteromonas sp. SR41-6]MBB1410236.1 hypothetical protein [Pseudoalteromonas sp. SG44-17]MBB1471097.1 hypothetical protein [Pseudoalteromonas sp. SG41-5]